MYTISIAVGSYVGKHQVLARWNDKATVQYAGAFTVPPIAGGQSRASHGGPRPLRRTGL